MCYILALQRQFLFKWQFSCTIYYCLCVRALSSPSPQMILWLLYETVSYLMLVWIQGYLYMYPYLSIFSYKDLWSWNKNTVVNNKLRGLWKISFEVLNFLLQGWLQLHFLHFLMARTAGMFKWKKGFQVILLLLCIAEFWFFLMLHLRLCPFSLYKKLLTPQALNFKSA